MVRKAQLLTYLYQNVPVSVNMPNRSSLQQHKRNNRCMAMACKSFFMASPAAIDVLKWGCSRSGVSERSREKEASLETGSVMSQSSRET
jgi:hypothetical protein